MREFSLNAGHLITGTFIELSWVSDRFGRAHGFSIGAVGMLLLLHTVEPSLILNPYVLFYALGPRLDGRLRDDSGSYDGGLLLVVMMVAVSVVACWYVARNNRVREFTSCPNGDPN